jgi:hypothetical protein
MFYDKLRGERKRSRSEMDSRSIRGRLKITTVPENLRERIGLTLGFIPRPLGDVFSAHFLQTPSLQLLP